MNIVMTSSKAKGTYIQVRIREDLKEEVRLTAEARGLSISALIHSLLTQAVRDEKTQYPIMFARAKVQTPLEHPSDNKGGAHVELTNTKVEPVGVGKKSRKRKEV